MLRLDTALAGGCDPSFRQRDDPMDGWKKFIGLGSRAVHDVCPMHIFTGRSAVRHMPIRHDGGTRLNCGCRETGKRGCPGVGRDLHPGPARSAAAGVLHRNHHFAQRPAAPDTASGTARNVSSVSTVPPSRSLAPAPIACRIRCRIVHTDW